MKIKCPACLQEYDRDAVFDPDNPVTHESKVGTWQCNGCGMRYILRVLFYV